MQEKKLFNAIGLMSGTSMDGIDIAYLQSDGKSIIRDKKFSYFPYSQDFRQKLLHIINSNPSEQEIKEVKGEFTAINANLVEEFLKEHNLNREEIDLISFPGHTIFHDPQNGITRQIGDPNLLESQTKIRTIGHFRRDDVAKGGQGAPLVPIYHFYMTKDLAKPLAILNIGGVNNITYIPNDNENDMVAFDICFGNAPFDDLVSKNTEFGYDDEGNLALSGKINQKICDEILKNEIFYKKPPKSFDRNDFHDVLMPINQLDLADGLASLSYIHAKALAKNIELFLDDNIKTLLICGGGVKNQAIMKYIKELLPDTQVNSTDQIGFDSDQIEAQAFAFLGIRKLLELPISFQKTTGILPETGSSLVSSQY